MEAKDGGPMFISCDGQALCRLSIRDYFAAHAVSAIITRKDAWKNDNEHVGVECAALAYAVADAMLAARAQTEAKP